MWWSVLSLVMFYSSQISAVYVSCKNDWGHNVDWYILYKAPNISPLTGLEYIYIDSRGKKTGSDLTTVLSNTLRPMLGSVRFMPSSFGFLSYSDQPPGSTANSDKFGHSKGVVLGDSSTLSALWLTHSTPQFPFRRDQNNFYPPSGKVNAQTFMCVSLQFSQLQNVGDHLQNTQAFPFDYDLPHNFPKELQDAANWITDDYFQGKLRVIKTKGKKMFAMMAKYKDPTVAVGDLYVRLAAAFDSDMKVQSWNGQGNIDKSYCEKNKRKVENILGVRTDLGNWANNHDHSKWALTISDIWTCVGDMNRVVTQYPRWGGALCIYDKHVNTYFKLFVNSFEKCNTWFGDLMDFISPVFKSFRKTKNETQMMKNETQMMKNETQTD